MAEAPAEERTLEPPTADLREPLLVYLAVIVFLGGLARLRFIPFIAENLGALAILPFVYLPAWILWKKRRDFKAYGISWDAFGRHLGTGLLLCVIVLPPFWLGYHLYGTLLCGHEFAFQLPEDFLERFVGNLLVIALPEEFLFRGYLQTHTDLRWPGGIRFLGARVGWSAVVVSALFALLHLATDLAPFKLGVFFPSLLFCWLKARTGSIVPGIVFHGLANVMMNTLEASYGVIGICAPVTRWWFDHLWF